MVRLWTLDDLQKHFDQARDKLSQDRHEILVLAPLPEDFSPDSYGFSYLRAERVGLSVITQSLDEVSWLPMRLDPQAEIVLENKEAMKKWLGLAAPKQPNSDVFGNDFIHALARVAMTQGWQSDEFRTTSKRIGTLFHDLSCLIGLIYYGVWMAENGIAGVPITNPDDLGLTAQEICLLTRSPEIARILYQRALARYEERQDETTKKKARPSLRVVKNGEKDKEE